MPRIRAIKPMFFKNEILAELPPLTRLLFVGLWGLADRRGRLEYRPKFIKVEVLPYDECDIENMLETLAKKDFLRIYERKRKKIIWIVNFEKHQRISGKEADSDSELPPYQKGKGKQRGSNGEAAETAGREGKGREQEGKGKNNLPTPLTGEIEKWFESLWHDYPSKDGRKEAFKHFFVSVKSHDDFSKCRMALDNYLKSNRVKDGYIKNGSTWFNNWRDWIDFKEVAKNDGKRGSGIRAEDGKYSGIEEEIKT